MYLLKKKIKINNTLTPLSLSTMRCVDGASHLFPAKTLTTSGAAFFETKQKLKMIYNLMK